MKLSATRLPGVYVLAPTFHHDARGSFCETFNAAQMAELGLPGGFVQDNQSVSRWIGTVRGLHCQIGPHAQAKLVRCQRGRIRDVAVDMRRGSDHYGQHVMVELDARAGHQMFIPEGFLHGFITLEEHTVVAYKCTAAYAPDHERSVFFNDPELGIYWGVTSQEAILSEKDAQAPMLRDVGPLFDIGLAA